MTWNNLKQPTESKKRPETTYNEQETTSNNLQGLEKTCNKQKTTWKQPTTSKKQPETTHDKYDTTYNDLNLPTASKKETWNNKQQADFQIILQYGANVSLL